MTGAAARPWFGDGALETRTRARIDQLLGACFEIAEQLLLAADKARIKLGPEFSGFCGDLAGMGRASLSQPFLQAPVQHLHIAMAERQEHPPCPGGCDPGSGIVSDHGIGWGNPETPEAA